MYKSSEPIGGHMKKLFVMVAMLTALVVPVKKANAAFFPYSYTAYMISTIPIFGGLALMGGDDYGRCRAFLCLDKVAGAGIMLAGIVFLDEEASIVELGEISESKAREIGLDTQEREELNSSLDEVNMLKDEILATMLSEQTDSVQRANELWEESSDYLSPKAYSGLLKVRVHIGREIMKNR